MAKKKSAEPRDWVMRHDSSVIDQEACDAFNYFIPSDWVRNSLPKDYAKDFLVELAKRGGPVKQQFFVQVKGTERINYVDNGKAVSFEMELAHLGYYAAEVQLPLFLIVIDVKTKRGHWIFAQKYLRETLGWRSTATHCVRIPVSNDYRNHSQLEAAVKEASDWMEKARQRPLSEQIAEKIREIQAKDSRITARIDFSEFEHLIRLEAKEPVTLNFRLNPKQRRNLRRMQADLFERGIAVKFDAGEIEIEGSVLFSEIVAQGGTLQLQTSMKGQATISILDQSGEPVETWSGINGAIVGGQKELYFSSELGRCPFTLKVGPFPDKPGRIKVGTDPMLWDGSHLLSLPYFDRVKSLFRRLASNPRVKVHIEVEGMTIFLGQVTLANVERFGPFVEWLDAVAKARVVAQHFNLNPVFGPKYLGGPVQIQAVRFVYGLLVDKSFELEPCDNIFEVPIPRDKLDELTVLRPTEEHNVTLWDEDSTFHFFGEQVRFKNVAWYFPDLEMLSTKEEIERLAAEPGDEVRVLYRTPKGTRPSVRILSDDEVSQLRAFAPNEIEVPGEVKIQSTAPSVGMWPSSRFRDTPSAKPKGKPRRKKK